jgi:hypothetical protein
LTSTRPEPAGRQLATHDEVFSLRVEPAIGQQSCERSVRRQLERRLDDRAIGTGPDERAVAPIARHQSEGVDDDGLSGAGFAGEDVQSGTELDDEVVDRHEVADAQRLEHGQRLREAVTEREDNTAGLSHREVSRTIRACSRC